MNIYELIVKVYKKIKNQPTYLATFLLDILVTIIYFPKYLYHLIRKQKIVAFDWGDGIYSSFYLPLSEKLESSDLNIIFFFCFGAMNYFELNIFRRGLPRIYADFLDNKIVICATASKYKKLPKTIRIQIFHGLASFGVVWQKAFIGYFDVLFLSTKFQWQQLQGEYKKIVAGKSVFKIGYPKIDKYVFAKEKEENKADNKITLFYGPTYHREISSIFEFLPIIIEICKRNKYKLIIKLHPFLYDKYNYDSSGGVNWFKKISEYKKAYQNIVFLGKNENAYAIDKYFRITNIFLTDVSGFGYEFVLATSKPIIFLGNKLKIPLDDLRKGNIKKYEKYPEIYYRRKIGPVVEKLNQLETTLKRIIERDGYKTEREKFRQEYIFNLGTSANVAVSKIKEIYERLS